MNVEICFNNGESITVDTSENELASLVSRLKTLRVGRWESLAGVNFHTQSVAAFVPDPEETT